MIERNARNQDWLGDTREAIGREKAGVMRSDKPVVYADPDRPPSIDEVAKTTGARLIARDRDFQVRRDGDRWSWYGTRSVLEGMEAPALPGEFQINNAAGALALVESLGRDDVLEPERVRRALASVSLAGRSQTFRDDHSWRFDVAHNPAAAMALCAVLETSPEQRRIALVGMMNGKDVEGVVKALEPAVERWIAVAPESERALPAAELGRRIANALNCHCRIADSVDDAIQAARESAGEQAEILVLGSFSIVGPVQEKLGL